MSGYDIYILGAVGAGVVFMLVLASAAWATRGR
jgi:hypothetical protein